MPEIITADHIAAEKGAFEPQRKNNFSLRMQVLGRVIQQSLSQFPFPKEVNDPIVVNFGNEQRKVAGRATFDNLDLVVKDFADQPVMSTLIAWRRLVYDPTTGKIGLAKDYKKHGEIVMFAPNGTLERTWKIQGVWPSRMDPGGGDMEANSQNLVTIVLSVDKAIESTNMM